MSLQFPRILVAALASRYNQARLWRAKGWIAFINGIFDSWDPPIWVPVTARPQDSQPAIRTTLCFVNHFLLGVGCLVAGEHQYAYI